MGGFAESALEESDRDRGRRYLLVFLSAALDGRGQRQGIHAPIGKTTAPDSCRTYLAHTASRRGRVCARADDAHSDGGAAERKGSACGMDCDRTSGSQSASERQSTEERTPGECGEALYRLHFIEGRSVNHL